MQHLERCAGGVRREGWNEVDGVLEEGLDVFNVLWEHGRGEWGEERGGELLKESGLCGEMCGYGIVGR